MKKFYLFWLSLFFLVNFSGCQKQYNELGYDTFAYYINGTFRVANGFNGFPNGPRDYPQISFVQDSLNAPRKAYIGLIDHEGVRLYYVIPDFQGVGMYSLNNDKLESCGASKYRDSENFDIPSGQCYIHILEWDEESRFISALFEAHLQSSNQLNLDITRGRIVLRLH